MNEPEARVKRFQTILGYSWAVLALPILMATFIGMAFWAQLLANSTGVKISPWFSGGEIVRTNQHDGYETRIHRPVFDGLVGERSRGFIQVDWMVRDPRMELPPQIDEPIDYDGNGTDDFRVQLSTRNHTVTVVPLSTNVLALERSFHLAKGNIVRVQLRK
jgi:hypothetical protein